MTNALHLNKVAREIVAKKLVGKAVRIKSNRLGLLSGTICGSQLKFAKVDCDGVVFEFAWETVQRAVEQGTELIVLGN